MTSALERLLAVSSSALSSSSLAELGPLREKAGALAGELQALLQKRNGFYSFESALHVFPTVSEGQERGLGPWNERSLWIEEYGGLADDFLFFGEDVFGGQFGIKSGQIWAFDPETGSAEAIALSMEEWATQLMDDYEVLTGFPLAHEWQRRNGPIPPGKRLVPRTPFVLGGEFALNNLVALDSVEGMRFRASIAVQIRDLPDGAQVKLTVVD